MPSDGTPDPRRLTWDDPAYADSFHAQRMANYEERMAEYNRQMAAYEAQEADIGFQMRAAGQRLQFYGKLFGWLCIVGSFAYPAFMFLALDRVNRITASFGQANLTTTGPISVSGMGSGMTMAAVFVNAAIMFVSGLAIMAVGGAARWAMAGWADMRDNQEKLLRCAERDRAERK